MSEMEMDKEIRWDLIVFWLVFVWLCWSATDWSGGLYDWVAPAGDIPFE